MRRIVPLALSLIVTSCAPAPRAPETPAGPPPEEAAAEPSPKSPEPPPLSTTDRLIASADRYFVEGSRLRAEGKPADAADRYARALAVYDALNNLDSTDALETRSANAREARDKAAAEASAAAKEAWKTEFLAPLPPAPFPHYADVLRRFEESVARNPEDRAARRRLAALYLADERYPDAAAALESARDAEPVFELATAALWYRLGRNADAAARLDEVRLRWRRELPLAVERPAFCLTPPKGYGRFTPADTAAFFPGQKLWLYFEVANASVAREGDSWRIGLRCDYEILDSAGRAVAWPEVKDFARDYDPAPSGSVPDDVCLQLGLVLPRAPRGRYTLVVKLADKVEAKETEKRLDFELK
jgi:tetratricopeptide (TPR) repeat protein